MTPLRGTNKEFWFMFQNSRVPSITEFQGEYAVDMLTVLPSLARLSHRKVFEQASGGVIGRNILFRNMNWGSFFLEEAVMPGPEKLKVVVINYGARDNTILTRGIRDYVRAVEGTTLYLGRFTVMLCGKPRFFGYFSLRKIGA